MGSCYCACTCARTLGQSVWNQGWHMMSLMMTLSLGFARNIPVSRSRQPGERPFSFR